MPLDLPHLKACAAAKLEARIKYIKDPGFYIIIVPQGYKCKETVYKDRVFYTLEDLEDELNK